MSGLDLDPTVLSSPSPPNIEEAVHGFHMHYLQTKQIFSISKHATEKIIIMIIHSPCGRAFSTATICSLQGRWSINMTINLKITAWGGRVEGVYLNKQELCVFFVTGRIV